MQKNIDLAKRIAKNTSKDWGSEFFDLNILSIFKPIYENVEYDLKTANTIAAYLILSYDNDSNWLNYNQDRLENKDKILKSLGATPNFAPYNAIVINEDEAINDIIADYLRSQCDWRWENIISLLDYSAEMIRFAKAKTEEEKTVDKMNKEGEIKTLTSQYDAEKIAKINILRSDLFTKARESRHEADKLMAELNKDLLQLNQAVQKDFGFEPTDEKVIPIFYENWRDFVRNVVVIHKQKQREEDNQKRATKKISAAPSNP